ncbi:unnamed protein product [Auanema sp. JU1783]|nr:unnamed protein product [Auanema sp. JU1783]
MLSRYDSSCTHAQSLRSSLKVHDLVNDNQKTEEQKIALAKEMVQSLPMEQQEGVLGVIKSLIEAFVQHTQYTLEQIREKIMTAKQQKLEAVQNMKPMKRQAGQSHSSESNSVSAESKEKKP